MTHDGNDLQPAQGLGHRRYVHAITRVPGPNFCDGKTSSRLGSPDYRLALDQHAEYCAVLRRLGVSVCTLPADPRHPDGPFVEDTAVVTERGTVLMNPGETSRRDEVAEVENVLAAEKFSSVVAAITSPGTADGGDVLHIDDRFFIGVSKRTNAVGAEQLRRTLVQMGFEAEIVEVPAQLLHLKTGITYLGKNLVVAIPAMAQHPAFLDFTKIVTAGHEQYAANCLTVNGTVLVPAGFPGVTAAIKEQGLSVVEIAMTEFKKMDGGLTCLSLLM